MRENRTPGSARGAPGNRCPYLDGPKMNRLIEILLVLSVVSAIIACDNSPKTPSPQIVDGGWRLVDQDESHSGENEFQVYVTAENPPEEVTLRFKRPGSVKRGSSIGGKSIVVFEGIDAEFHFDFRELLAQRDQFREDQLLDLEQFRMKNGQQAGAGQPATRSESQPEASSKPQPESEGRSR